MSPVIRKIPPPPAQIPIAAPFERDVPCPLCDYNLRGLTDPHPRCPECGYRFEWSELLDAARRHPFLFEHHPRHNLWSWWRTFDAGHLPRRFWSSVQPTHEIVVRRLLIYWLTVGATIALLAAMEIVHRLVRTDLYAFTAVRGIWYQWIDDRRDAAAILTMTFLLAWPWLTFAALLIFRISMHRARVRPRHILRCVIYSATDLSVYLAIGIAVAVTYEVSLYRWMKSFRSDGTILTAIAWGLPLAVVLMTLRLWRAYKLYLRFPHSFAVAFTSQLIVGLLLLKAALDLAVLQ